MARYKNLVFYIGVTGAFSLLMYWVIVKGSALEIGRNIVAKNSNSSQWQEFVNSLMHNLGHPLAILLAQIVTIILAARIFGWLFAKIGQPTVIGEIIAGIALGPSLIGMYFPDFSALLFPAASLGNLQFLSQIGLILFMFIVGMELDLNVLKSKANDAVVVSHASIIIPFAMGLGLAYFIYESFAPMGVEFVSFGLFLGIAMSITAFPVLARIVQERGIHKTRLGTVVITCAAADDITAWCILAAVIAIVKAGSFVSSLYVIALAAGYVVVMIKVVRPFLKRVGDLHNSREHLSKPIVAIFFVALICSAYATEVIGIHALFGAFMAGAVMPENSRFRNIFIEKVEDVSLVLLLPIFFVFTGLRTQIGLLNDVYLWQVTGLIILVAVSGKFLGSALAAKFVGQNWKDSLTIGALMNTRGLMELVVLNIGYDLGVLTPEIFAMMVIMALVTTFMTGPALDFINWSFRKSTNETPQAANVKTRLSILISFGNPVRGKSLLKLASVLFKTHSSHAAITAMHLSPVNELNSYNVAEYEKESFAPILGEAQTTNLQLTTLFKPSLNIDADIAEETNSGKYDLLLVGIGQSIYEGSLLGKIIGFTTNLVHPERIFNHASGSAITMFDERTQSILSKSTIPVGVLIDKGLDKLDRVFIPILCASDEVLLQQSLNVAKAVGLHLTVLDEVSMLSGNKDIAKAMATGLKIDVVSRKGGAMLDLAQQSLLVVSLESWQKLIDEEHGWITNTPSVLIIAQSNAKNPE